MSVASPVVMLFQAEATRHLRGLRDDLGRLSIAPEDAATLAQARSRAGALARICPLVEADALGTLARGLEERLARGFVDSPSLEALRVGLSLLEECVSASDPQRAGQALGDRVASVLRALSSGPRPSMLPAPDSQAPAAPRDARLSLLPALGMPALPRVSVVPRPSRASGPSAVENMPAAQAPDPTLLGFFRQDLQTSVDELSRHLVQLESETERPVALARLMRAAHSLKGAARISGAEAVVALSHAMEDGFVAAQRGELHLLPEHVDLLLAATDRMALLARVPVQALWRVIEEHDAELRSLAEQVTAIAAPPATAPAARAEPGGFETTPPTRQIAFSRSLTNLPPKVLGRAPENEAQSEDRVVRVTARSIERFVGLSGEALVKARSSAGFVAGLSRLKQRQAALSDLVERRLSGEAAQEARELLAACREGTDDLLSHVEEHGRTLEDLTTKLYDEALKSRMRPFNDGIQGLSRLARDTARRLGKQVVFEVLGERTGVDRDVLEALAHPLQHLVKNAIDHGLESPDVRRAQGKPAAGKLRIEARHHAGTLAIVVSDDGSGVNLASLRHKLVERGLVEPAMLSALSESELLDFLFLPGFSTSREVSDISGRGVGLDVVKSAIEASGGHVRITTHAGQGTTFHLKLPVTRSVIRAVIVEVGGELYALPLLRVERIVRVPHAAIKRMELREYVDLDEASVGLVRAHELLETRPEVTSDELLLVTVGDGTRTYAVVVDRFVGEHDLVVRPLDARLGKVPNVSAAAILSHGAPVLILDVDDLLRSIQERLTRAPVSSPTASTPVQKRVLVVDDSLTVRELERQLLTARGYEVDLAVDGTDGVRALSRHAYDLVISDVDMPNMNGFQLVRHIKQDPRLRHTPVIIVSYKDRPEDRKKGLEAGANAYLTKSSFHDRSLLEAVADLIGEPT